MLETLIMPESTYYYAIIFCLRTSIWFFVNRIIHSEKDVEARHHYQEILFIPALWGYTASWSDSSEISMVAKRLSRSVQRGASWLTLSWVHSAVGKHCLCYKYLGTNPGNNKYATLRQNWMLENDTLFNLRFCFLQQRVCSNETEAHTWQQHSVLLTHQHHAPTPTQPRTESPHHPMPKRKTSSLQTSNRFGPTFSKALLTGNSK